MSLRVKNLCFTYGDGNEVLKDISFRVADGEVLFVLGPNGVGKSTLFKCMLGLLKGYKGTVEIDKVDIRELTPKQMSRFIAYIPQSHVPVFNYSVFDIVLMGTTSTLTAYATPGEAQAAYADCALETLGISHLRDRSFMKISGGERQLALVARALAQQAKVLIMDEPTANLDYGNQVLVQNRVRRLASDGYTVIQSTHNPDQAYLCADRLLALKGGAVLAEGAPADIINERLIKELYNVDVKLVSFEDDSARVCVPIALAHKDLGSQSAPSELSDK